MKSVVVGRIAGLFGVRGWVKVFSYTEPREALLDYKGWVLSQGSEEQAVEIVEGQRHGKTVIVHLQGIDDRERAAGLVGAEISVPREALPAPEVGQYYWSDLTGLSVVNRDGDELGKIDHMLETGAHDVMVVKGEQERLIPFVTDEIVVSVDLDARIVTVDWEWD